MHDKDDTHPCWLQVVLQWLADNPRVLHGDGWAREILVSYFGLKKGKVFGLRLIKELAVFLFWRIIGFSLLSFLRHFSAFGRTLRHKNILQIGNNLVLLIYGNYLSD